MQEPNQPHKTIDDLDFGEHNFSGYYMVVGCETFNPKWKASGKARRPPAHLHIMDRNQKYAQLGFWLTLFYDFGNTEDQRVQRGNAFLHNFLLGATYQFSSLTAKQLLRTE